jgi:hypothetical protein
MTRHIRQFLISTLTLASLFSSGCHSSGPSRRVVTPEPGLSSTVEPDGTINSSTSPAVPMKTTSFVDRHPLFYRPRDYYENSGNNGIVKVAAATFIGVPAGIFSEAKQIITGTPPEPKY